MKISKFRLSLAFTAIGFIGIFLASPGNAIVRTDSCGTVGTLQNGSFENGSTSWRTTATDGAFEIWGPSSTTRPNSSTFNIGDPGNDYTKDGQYLAEPQANWAGGANQGLYQDIATTPGAQIFVSFWHHHREGYGTNQTLTARVGAVPVNIPANSTWNSTEQNNSTSFGEAVASNVALLGEDWEQARGIYTVPSNQTNTRFLFVSSDSTAGGGNLVDDIDFTPFLACPVTRTVTFGTPDTLNAVTTPGVTYGIDQTITSITSASNPSGSAGTASRSGNVITFTPTAAGNSQNVDYTASMTFSGTTYTDEARITYNVSATVPGAPTGLSATTTGPTAATSNTTGASATISWTAPTNNGGVAISDYVIEYKQGSDAWQTFADGVSSSTSATVTGLSGASTTLFRVSAKNDGSGYTGPGTTGTGATSSELSVNPWVCGNLNQFSEISGLALWLRADCVNGTPNGVNDGTQITTWEDLSGNNRDAGGGYSENNITQSRPTFENDATNSINSQPVLSFTRGTSNSGAGSAMRVNYDIRATTRPDLTVFVVYQVDRIDGDTNHTLGLFGNDNGAWDRFFIAKWQEKLEDAQGQTGTGGTTSDSNDGLFSYGPNSGSNLNSSNVEDAGVGGTTRLLTAIYDRESGGCPANPPLNSKAYFGSTLIRSFCDTTDATAAKSQFYIGIDGDDNPFRGRIAEVILFDRALSSDLPSINQYLNDKYNIGLNVATNLPDVILVDPRATSVNLPELTLTQSTNAMICLSQVSNSSGGTLSGSATIGVTRTSSVSGVTENTSTNLWRYSGSRANVETQIGSIQITGTGSNPVANTSSKWLRIHVTSATSSASDCTDSQVNNIVEIRPITLDSNLTVDVSVN